ncbi:MAG: 2-hydroxyacid dehydrogenase [Actinomycetales bacterium]|nr:2-hydroxyacid dehydrogenase [Actinomycetales bacterium]
MSDIPLVLQVGALLPTLADSLRTEFHAERLPDEPVERAAWLAGNAGRVAVAVTTYNTGVGPDLMAALPNLRAVLIFGVGYDSTDTAQARERGITIATTPGVLTDAVADLAVGLLIDTLRGVSRADRFVRAGRWAAGETFPLTREVSGSTVGILGLGRIGRAIADRLAGFGCAIAYHSRTAVDGVPYPYAATPVELAAASDVLVVVVPGGPATEKLVDDDVLAALGPEGYLVNVARGSVVDQEALVRRLASGELAGAGLDVFADEPHVPAELLALDTVVLQPHVASATEQTRQAMADLLLENLRTFLATGTVLTPVP